MREVRRALPLCQGCPHLLFSRPLPRAQVRCVIHSSIRIFLTYSTKTSPFDSIPPLPTQVQDVGHSAGTPTQEPLFDELMRGIPASRWLAPLSSRVPVRVCLP